ncbi:MAG: hypothetical protein IT428_26375 [Planctomycetaceae bacterium]|nr:hypothetical protein [Planctomycetaceae bacterium]
MRSSAGAPSCALPSGQTAHEASHITLWRAGRLALGAAAFAAVFATGLCALAPAADAITQDVTRVEEDWELIIEVPEPDQEAPQITTVISPFSNLDSLHGVFEINHATQPAYSNGGLQLQVWDGDDLYDYRRARSAVLLRTSNEKVTWTSSMSLLRDLNWLRFEISNGQSTTWGTFGNNSELRRGTGTYLNRLNSYSPETSVENSRVGFASNRVKKLTLKKVRYYADGNLVSTDETERVVFEPNDLVETME